MFNWSKFYGKNKKTKEDSTKDIYESPETTTTTDSARCLALPSTTQSTSVFSDSNLEMSTSPIAILTSDAPQLARRCSVSAAEVILNRLSPPEKKVIARRRSVRSVLPHIPPGTDSPSSSPEDSSSDSQGKQIYVAIYDYEARTKEDLSFRKNDHLEIIQDVDSDWWLACDTNGTVGYIPSSFVAKIKSVEAEPWYFGYITRSEANRLLLQTSNTHGSYLIRVSETRKDEYSLSVRDGDIVKHYRIRSTEEGNLYISPQNVFPYLKKLVKYYSSQTSGMCCKFQRPCIKLEKPDTCGLSYNTVDTWEIQREQIELKEKLGTGNFGEVYKGVWNKTTEIAVKTLKKGSATQKEFLAEAQVMKKLRHPKLIQLYGVCTNTEPFYIIAEFMKFGSLDKYLRVYGPGSKLLEKLSIGAQVASGMAYLESHNFIHRDLAARNVLVGEGLTCKVADFGLSRILQEDEYLALEGTRFPIKWTAPEALCYNRFSVKSDVWSFAIFLMEVFTNGAVPYPEFTNQEVIEKTSEGYRMQRPRNCPREIYTLMMECWDKEPQQRPSFDTLWQTMESFCAILLNK